jgi:hypothetical protein
MHMRHAHNGHRHEPLQSEVGLPACYRLLLCAISGWCRMNIQHIIHELFTSSSAIRVTEHDVFDVVRFVLDRSMLTLSLFIVLMQWHSLMTQAC